MKEKQTIETTLVRGLIAVTICVVAFVLISFWQTRRLQDTSNWVRHTNQILRGVEDVLDLNLRYELGVKNFLLTGITSSLDSSVGLTSRLHRRLADIKQLTADNPDQQLRIDTLIQYAALNRASLDSAIHLSQRGDIVGAGRMITESTAAGYSYQIENVADRFKTKENSLLDVRRQDNRLRASELQYVLWALIAAAILLAFIVVKKIRVDVIRERRLKTRLNQFNKALEETVKTQTSDLAASEEKYKTLFYKSPLPKWIYDQETLQFLEVNEAAIQHYGYSQDEFRSMTIRDIRPLNDVPRLMEDLENVRTSGGTYTDNNWRHIKKNGEVIDVELTAHAVEYGQRKARMVIINDITERRRSEEMLRHLNTDLQKRASELAASNAELERFAYIASHDLQEPLRMVSSFLQLLQKKYDGHLDEKATQYIRYAVDGAERMKALILDLLEYSRAGAGKGAFAPVDMCEVVKAVSEIFHDKIIASRGRIDIGKMPVVLGDKVQLTQLVQNLVSNALKYHGEKPPHVQVMAEEVERGWKFSVKDNGIGIDPLFFDKIFIIFQRLHNKSDYSGTGIGLAICKKIVERHGGRIWVESSPGTGSIFYFTIVTQQ
ncbi:MAG TPA: ATP-binding protein [Puia sp.]|nr:ATP-binding protein [Puia sp.]